MNWFKKLFSFLMKPRTLSAPGWNFSVMVDGDDLVVKGTTATWFGGNNDPQDNGETASGVMTRGNPDCMGCALPVIVRDAEGKPVFSTHDSPLALTPHIPWHTQVQVTHHDNSITIPLIDNGPARSSTRGIDLTVAAFHALGGCLKEGVISVDYRVLGAAKYLSTNQE